MCDHEGREMREREREREREERRKICLKKTFHAKQRMKRQDDKITGLGSSISSQDEETMSPFKCSPGDCLASRISAVFSVDFFRFVSKTLFFCFDDVPFFMALHSCLPGFNFCRKSN
jgi:hypothetical protein